MKIKSIFFLRCWALCLTIMASLSAGAQMTAQIGSGTQGPLTNNAIYSPICRFSASSTNDFSRSNLLYTSAELNNAGITNGATINKISFYKIGTGATNAGFTFEIYMRNSTTAAPLNTATTWADIIGTHTQVYTTTAQAIPSATGWVEFALSTPFAYTGQNLEIAFNSDMSAITGIDPTTGPFDWQYTNGYQDYIIGAVSSSATPVLSGTVVNYKVRPNILFNYTAGAVCTSPPVAGTVVASDTMPCANNSIMLSLTGGTVGATQTYQWESSAAAAGPWTIIASSALTNVTPPVGTTTYYRCQVTCSGLSDVSAAIPVTVSGPMSGNYTINSSVSTSATNFQSFAEAMNQLSCSGINGPVVFNVAPGSGPYNGQVSIGVIQGISAANAVSINGNGTTISYTSTASANRPTLSLNGAQYITISNLNIEANGTTYGWGVHFTNNADNDTLRNCNVTVLSTSTSSGLSMGVVVSGSSTSTTTAGNSDGIVLLNNVIKGGYHGIGITGASAAKLTNNKVIGNTIQDFYATGILVSNNQNAEIKGNDISRAIRTGVTTFTGIELGSGNAQAKVDGNKIHDTHNAATTQTGAAYGINVSNSDAIAGEENKIYNNLIYNFNSASGTQYGLANSGANGALYYYNTIVLDYGSTVSGVAYGFYQSSLASNIHVKNNVFYVTRNGTSAKWGIYLNTGTSTVVSDSNVLYINGTGGNSYIGRAASVDYGTLASWQGQGYDIRSFAEDPVFSNPASGDYSTTNNTINNLASPNPDFPQDINGTQRSNVAPDFGAFENSNVPLGVKLISFKAKRKNRDVLLEWRVASETDMDRYEIERSENGISFDQIAGVKATKGALGGLYDLTDAGIFNGLSASSPLLYYRLKMLEQNNDYTYSPIQIVKSGDRKSRFAVHPNPFKDRLLLPVSTDVDVIATVTLTDMQGKTIMKNSVQIRKEDNLIELTGLGQLRQGMYIIHVNINGTGYVQQIVKE